MVYVSYCTTETFFKSRDALGDFGFKLKSVFFRKYWQSHLAHKFHIFFPIEINEINGAENGREGKKILNVLKSVFESMI